MDGLITEFEEALLDMNRLRADRLIQQAAVSRPLLQCLETIIVPALEHIGIAWEKGDVALSQVYVSSRICEDLVLKYMPAKQPGLPGQPRLAIGVFEDSHGLGKRMVQAVLQSAGYQMLDYGVSLTEPALLSRLRVDQVQVLLLSTLTLRSALSLGRTTAAARTVVPGLRIVVGGAPFLLEPELWREVGADAMGANAAAALKVIKQLLPSV